MQSESSQVTASPTHAAAAPRGASAEGSSPERRVCASLHFRRSLFIVSAVGAAMIYGGYQRRPCGADCGTSFAGDAPEMVQEGETFRVGTFNIHGGVGKGRVRDLARTAATLTRLDLVGLNEVHGADFGESEGQAEWLARRLKRRWLFAASEERWWHSRFGNAVLSSLPATSWQAIPLRQRHSHSCRNAVFVTARHGPRELHLLITHLDRADDERTHQLRALADLFLALSAPAVLLGDLNCTQDDPELRRLLSQPGVGDPLGEVMGEQTPPHIDWILTRGLTTIDAGIRDEGASDHPLVWAELSYGGATRD